ncbi:cyclodeaminase/cyclohydrolase family protein [uncultured Bacteroides sp.]|uniref:cyclodeaminase/cyclohydrolase family protein n=1 Tax=uncultured Bacteroides sp. TaxID=162156 RepID=UPI002AAB2EC7|nr:cyclodeaminase/cyclohydrolase family protein [uncultured Bacteroides sp.]
MLADLTIREYLAKTASGDSVPAGGSASAIGAGLAASLAEKIANVIAFKQEEAEVKTQLENIAECMNALREEFIQCIDRDVDAYNELLAAHKMPEGTNEEKMSRDEQIQKSVLIAAMVPFDVAEMAMRMMDFISEVAKLADKKLAVDVCAAMSFARSAVVSALLIVKENLLPLKSKQIVQELTKKSLDIENNAIQKEQELLDWIKASY